MKKRLTKVLALGLAAAMVAGAPLSAMAAEVNQADAAVTSEVASEEKPVAEENAGTDAEDAQATAGEETGAQPEENAADVAADAEVPEADAQTDLEGYTSEAPEAAASAADDEIAVQALTNGKNPAEYEGLVQLNDGNWYYMENGRLSYKADRTLKPVNGSWWYVDDYKIDFSYTGFASTSRQGEDSWYVQNGQVQFGYTGAVTSKDANESYRTTYYVVNGRVATDVTGIYYTTVDGVDGWYYFNEGRLSGYSGLKEYNGSWWYIGSNGQIDFSYTGIAHTYDDAAEEEIGWYVHNGMVDFSYTGMYEGQWGNENKTPYQYYFVNGRLDESLTGVYYTTVNGVPGWYGFYKGQLATYYAFYTGEYGVGIVLPNSSGWWYVNTDNGMVDFSYTGLGWNKIPGSPISDYWYVENGQINFNYNGLCVYTDRWSKSTKVAYITNGQADPNVNGVYQLTVNGKTDWYGLWRGRQMGYQLLMNPNDGSWWYTGTDGLVDFSHTGVEDRCGWNGAAVDSWYVRNGQIDFSCNGWVKVNNSFDESYYSYYYIQNGRVSDYSGLYEDTIEGKHAWWKVNYGEVYQSLNYFYGTLEYYNGSWWYVSNSQVDFSYTGSVWYNGVQWYVENGRVNFDKTGFDAGSRYVQNGQYLDDFTGLVYTEWKGRTGWWAVDRGYCAYNENSYEEGRPNSFIRNESGLWAYENGKVDFNINGEFTDTWLYSVVVTYTYQVVNGLVTSMQVEVEPQQ